MTHRVPSIICMDCGRCLCCYCDCDGGLPGGILEVADRAP
jgi:hypothetical protein